MCTQNRDKSNKRCEKGSNKMQNIVKIKDLKRNGKNMHIQESENSILF